MVKGGGESQAKQVTRVTRDVEVLALGDLLERPRRATVAFVDREDVNLLPARARCMVDIYRIGVLQQAAPDLDNREVVLLIDDGPYWFELCGISVRGTATRIESQSEGLPGDLVWYAIEPRRVLAWDYGTIREEPSDACA